MDTVFGELSTQTRLFIGVAIIILIGLAYWLIARRLAAAKSGADAARGRQPRLALLDSTPVDSRRRLVLIRRDNVEHLLMIGGPGDIVVEQNIIRAVPVAPPREAPAVRSASLSEVMARAGEPLPPAGRELPDRLGADEDQEREPASEIRSRTEPSWPEPPPRAARHAGIGREPPVRPHLDEDRSLESLLPRGGEIRPRAEPSWSEPASRAGRLPEPAVRIPQPSEPVGRTETPVRSAPPITPASPKSAPEPAPPREAVRVAPSASDAEITDMAQRLEAALRRPMAAKERRPEPAKPGPSQESPPRQAPASGSFAAPPLPREGAKPEPGPRPPAEPRRAAASDGQGPARTPPAQPEPARTPPAQSVFDSLEQEMASLLGRPVGKE